LQHEIHMHSIEREADMSFVGLLEYTGIKERLHIAIYVPAEPYECLQVDNIIDVFLCEPRVV
jgi:hypothetical protein